MQGVRRLIWDEWNTDHISRHSVTRAEVEQSFKDIYLTFLNTHSGRIIALGGSGKRLISTILQPKESGEYYVVTARDMAKKERAIYRSRQERQP